MSEESTLNDRLVNLPHMKDEHIAVLEKEGLLTPEKLLPILKDDEKWNELHPKLKGIGPKTREKWIELLKEPKEAAPKRVERRLKKPVETVEEKTIAKKMPKPKEKEELEIEATEEPEEEELKEEEIKEEEEEAVEIVDEGEYVPKQKAKLPDAIIKALKMRKEISSKRPKFLREEYHRYVRMRTGWRKPRGMHSKARRKLRYRRKNVSTGYCGPKLVRGLHPSGFEEVPVFNVADLEKISNPDRQAARIGHSVGMRKRELIIDRADELGIRVLNRS